MASVIRAVASLWANIVWGKEVSVAEKADTESLREIDNLTNKCCEARARLDKATTEWEHKRNILIPHRSRCETVVSRLYEILAHERQRQDVETHESIADILETVHDLSNAISTINHLLRPFGEACSEARIELAEVENILFKYLEARNPQDKREAAPGPQEVQITAEMYPPDRLAEIEEECELFNHFKASQIRASGQKVDEDLKFKGMVADVEVGFDDGRSDINTQEKDDEIEAEKRNDMQLAFYDLKDRQKELSRAEETSEARVERVNIDAQVLEIGRLLGLRGLPIRDGSFVSPPSNIADKARPDLQTQPKQVMHPATRKQSTNDTQHGLFDGADIERPSADAGEEDERLLTEEEYRQYMAKMRTMIFSWKEQIEGGNYSLEGETRSVDEEALGQLSSVCPNDRFSYVLSTTSSIQYRRFELSTRRRAWKQEVEVQNQHMIETVRDESPWIAPLPGLTNWNEIAQGSGIC